MKQLSFLLIAFILYSLPGLYGLGNTSWGFTVHGDSLVVKKDSVLKPLQIRLVGTQGTEKDMDSLGKLDMKSDTNLRKEWLIDSSYTPDSLAYTFSSDSAKVMTEEELLDHYATSLENKLLSGELYEHYDTLLVEALERLIALHKAGDREAIFSSLEMRKIKAEDSTKQSGLDTLNYMITRLVGELKQDTALLVVRNIKGDSIALVMKKNYKSLNRFWFKTEVDDSIGSWIETIGMQELKVHLDPGVIQQGIDKSQMKKGTIKYRIKNSLSLLPMKKYKYIGPAWKYGGDFSLSFAQGYLESWAEGGENHVSVLNRTKAFLTYKKNKLNWDSFMRFKYGAMRSEEKGNRKNEDIFEIQSKLGLKAFNNWFYSVSANFNSQIFKGYDYPNDTVAVSDFLNPAYIQTYIGFDYKPEKNISVVLSPFSSKFTFVKDTGRIDHTKYGLEKGERLKKEMGAAIKAFTKIKFTDDIQLNSILGLFSNYQENPENIDLNLELQLSLQVNYYVKTMITANIIYDDDVNIPVYRDVKGVKMKVGETKKLQLKEFLSVGFAFKL